MIIAKLKQRNVPFMIITDDGEALDKRLPEENTIIHRWGASTKELVRTIKENLDDNAVVLSFDPLSLALAFHVSENLSSQSVSIKFAHGVFHPRDFKREGEKLHIHKLNRVLGKLVGIEKFYFMNDPCKRSHVEIWPRVASCADNIIPVPMDEHPFLWAKQSCSGPIRICSVGRIVPFKAYNFSSVNLISQVKDKDYIAAWDIYGHGSHVEELERLINNGNDQKVSYRGPLDPSDFDAVVGKYDLFIGMGLSAVQAAMIGVPTICAMDRSRDLSLGFFHQVPPGVVGESSEGLRTYGTIELINEYLSMGTVERIALSSKGREAASKYSVDLFLDSLSSFAKPVSPSALAKLRGMLSFGYLLLVGNSFLRKTVRRLKGACFA